MPNARFYRAGAKCLKTLAAHLKLTNNSPAFHCLKRQSNLISPCGTRPVPHALERDSIACSLFV